MSSASAVLRRLHPIAARVRKDDDPFRAFEGVFQVLDRAPPAVQGSAWQRTRGRGFGRGRPLRRAVPAPATRRGRLVPVAGLRRRGGEFDPEIQGLAPRRPGAGWPGAGTSRPRPPSGSPGRRVRDSAHENRSTTGHSGYSRRMTPNRPSAFWPEGSTPRSTSPGPLPSPRNTLSSSSASTVSQFNDRSIDPSIVNADGSGCATNKSGRVMTSPFRCDDPRRYSKILRRRAEKSMHPSNHRIIGSFSEVTIPIPENLQRRVDRASPVPNRGVHRFKRRYGADIRARPGPGTPAGERGLLLTAVFQSCRGRR